MSVLPVRLRRTPLDQLWQVALSLQSLAHTGPIVRRAATWFVFWPLLLALRIVEKA
jgi:hypothetical protein